MGCSGGIKFNLFVMHGLWVVTRWVVTRWVVISGRCTAPLLVDKKTRRIVSNDSAHIMRVLAALATLRYQDGSAGHGEGGTRDADHYSGDCSCDGSRDDDRGGLGSESGADYLDDCVSTLRMMTTGDEVRLLNPYRAMLCSTSPLSAAAAASAAAASAVPSLLPSSVSSGATEISSKAGADKGTQDVFSGRSSASASASSKSSKSCSHNTKQLDEMISEIEEVKDWLYEHLNNAVYRAGFATQQREHEKESRMVR